MSAFTLESKSTLLKFAVFALAVADEHRVKSSVETDTSAGPTMGPIGAGIGFAVLFVAMVLYLCKRDREEQREEKEAREKERLEAEAAEKPAEEENGAPEGDVEEGKVEVEVEIDDQQRA
jgi:hypothetical protein